MLNVKDFTEVGYISKSHGYRGNLIVKVNEAFPENIATIDFIFIEIDGGLVPFRISEVQLKNNDNAFFHLVDIDTDELSNTLIGCNVFFDTNDIPVTEDYGESDSYRIVIKGYLLVDNRIGNIGYITDVLSYKSSDVIQIIIDKKEILIPYNEELIISIDDDKEIIVMDLPEGILQIND